VGPAEAAGWRGRRADGSGLYWLGARYYDAAAGRFVSPDPLGHAASLSLYDYAGNDPVNGMDPDGRLGKGAWSGLTSGDSGTSPFGSSGAFDAGYEWGSVVGGFYGSLFGTLGAAVNPMTYVDGAIGFGGTVGTLYQEDGFLVAASYAATSWNVGAVWSGYANVDLATGQEVGDWYARGALISSGVGSTAGLAAGGLGLANRAGAAMTAGVDDALGWNYNLAAAEGPGGMTVMRGGTTPLFRAVNPAELADLNASGGVFRNPLGIEVKYFSETAEGAASYAQQAYRAGGTLYEGPYTIFSTDIFSDLINPIMRATPDRGIPTVTVPTELLPSLTPGQPLPITPLPRRP
jgi:RHS repeat-associated protein